MCGPSLSAQLLPKWSGDPGIKNQASYWSLSHNLGSDWLISSHHRSKLFGLGETLVKLSRLIKIKNRSEMSMIGFADSRIYPVEPAQTLDPVMAGSDPGTL